MFICPHTICLKSLSSQESLEFIFVRQSDNVLVDGVKPSDTKWYVSKFGEKFGKDDKALISYLF